ncbi:Hypothetical protein LUCI_4892 [Lucifera butyrica]|uniref:Uncharacterized protein n=1 Tax=Lucifera butyrica TaxID=1351585 RepID=A0A498RF71_9FIRM|nr:Hypothetical protein LUCI_4892 [Lucifera butyrica]
MHDPIACSHEAVREYGIKLTAWGDLPKGADAVIAAVSHKSYLTVGFSGLQALLRPDGLFVDVKFAYGAAGSLLAAEISRVSHPDRAALINPQKEIHDRT